MTTTGSQKPDPVFPLAAMVQYSQIHCLWELHRTLELQKITIYRVCVKVYLILDTHTLKMGHRQSLKAHAREHKKPRKRGVKWQGRLQGSWAHMPILFFHLEQNHLQIVIWLLNLG